MTPRVYTWTTEEGQYDWTDVFRITAEVSGYDYHGSYERPPEYREVCVKIERRFCPSEPDKCGGCEWDDVTEREFGSARDRNAWSDFVTEMENIALDMDDDAASAAFERAHEYNPEDMGH